MKKSLQATNILGVTLLEIMLVLAIAAMVIVMSIRYYQSASNNQKINAALNVITSVVAASESVFGAKGSLLTVSTDITPYLPNNRLPFSPWGGDITFEDPHTTDYKFVLHVPTTVCPALLALVQQNSKLTNSNCSTAGQIDVKVDMTS
jgi:type II secretory pathway pseudopilin PulG